MDIENLVELATPGPWIADEGMVNAPGLNIVECSNPEGDDWDNARFIAASREAVPDLIAEVRRLTKERDEAYDWAEDLSYPLIKRQGEILTGVAEALNGPTPPLTSWSHHDLAVKAEDLVRSKNHLASLKLDAESEVRRLEGIISDLESYLDNVQNSELGSDTIRRILEV